MVYFMSVNYNLGMLQNFMYVTTGLVSTAKYEMNADTYIIYGRSVSDS